MRDLVFYEKLREIIARILSDNHMDLVDLTFKKEYSRKVLKIFADNGEGITLDECVEINRIVGEALDKEDLISENYVLEVSSPGLDRPLKKTADFFRVKGKKISVFTYAPISDKKEFIGVLEAVNEETITILEEPARLVTIPIDKISKASLDYKSLA